MILRSFETLLFYIVFQVLNVLIKVCKLQPPNLVFLFVLLAFTSTGIIFLKFLELHSKISEKDISVFLSQNFFNGFVQPPLFLTPLTAIIW